MPACDPDDVDEATYGVEPTTGRDIPCSDESVEVPETPCVLTDGQYRELTESVPNDSDGDLHKALLVYIEAMKFVIAKYEEADSIE